jgi:xanthine dehydrogenase YagR molybdenum-binding subunit
VRLNRFVGAYDAGRIINPRTARSQAIGGTSGASDGPCCSNPRPIRSWRASSNATTPVTSYPRTRTIPELDVIFAGEFDSEASLLGSKGLGELTAVSVAPAIVNAVYHATGKRIRDLPVTVEKLL